MSNRADATAITDEGTTRADLNHSRQYVWDPIGLVWNRMTQPTGGSGGGGAVTVADGADVAQGTTSDAAWVSGSGTVIALLKKIASAGGSAVSVADGADVAQGTTTDTSAANTVVGILKAIKAAVQGTLTVATHAVTQSGTWTVQPGNTANTTAWKVDGSAVTQPVSGTFWQAAQPITDNAGSLTVDAPVGTPVFVELSDGAAVLKGQKLMASSVPVVIASDQSGVPVTGTFFQATQPVSIAATVTVAGTVTSNEGTKRAVSTSTLANVAASITVVTLQALNANRLMWMFHNDSASACYVKLGSAASATSFTVKVPANSYYELPATNVYTGIITALWDTATGSARVTELTA